MDYTYEEVNPTLIPNTTMKKRLLNGVERTYCITPIDGYVIHDSAWDLTVIDPETQEEQLVLGYQTGELSVPISYSFSTTEMQDEAGNTVTAYGDRLFYCKLASDVPTNQIFGVVNQPEIA